MKTDMSDLFAQAAYEARRQALITGAYPKRAFTIPSLEHCYMWDEIDPTLENAVKWLYRKETQAAIETFIGFVMRHGTTEVLPKNLGRETRSSIQGKERAVMGRSQSSLSHATRRAITEVAFVRRQLMPRRFMRRLITTATARSMMPLPTG
jgi:hypothetical protein